MEGDRAQVCAVSDHGEHLAPGSALATGDYFAEKRRANALAAQAFGDINRILDREAIGRARAILGGIGEAQRFAVRFGDKIGQTAFDGRTPAREQFFPFLEEKFPRLTRQYREWYERTGYAPESYRQEIRKRVAALRTKYGLAAGPPASTAAQSQRSSQMILFPSASP